VAGEVAGVLRPAVEDEAAAAVRIGRRQRRVEPERHPAFADQRQAAVAGVVGGRRDAAGEVDRALVEQLGGAGVEVDVQETAAVGGADRDPLAGAVDGDAQLAAVARRPDRHLAPARALVTAAVEARAARQQHQAVVGVVGRDPEAHAPLQPGREAHVVLVLEREVLLAALVGPAAAAVVAAQHPGREAGLRRVGPGLQGGVVVAGAAGIGRGRGQPPHRRAGLGLEREAGAGVLAAPQLAGAAGGGEGVLAAAAEHHLAAQGEVLGEGQGGDPPVAGLAGRGLVEGRHQRPAGAAVEAAVQAAGDPGEQAAVRAGRGLGVEGRRDHDPAQVVGVPGLQRKRPGAGGFVPEVDVALAGAERRRAEAAARGGEVGDEAVAGQQASGALDHRAGGGGVAPDAGVGADPVARIGGARPVLDHVAVAELQAVAGDGPPAQAEVAGAQHLGEGVGSQHDLDFTARADAAGHVLRVIVRQVADRGGREAGGKEDPGRGEQEKTQGDGWNPDSC